MDEKNNGKIIYKHKGSQRIQMLVLGDEVGSVQQWATKVGITPEAMRKRLKRMNVRQALTTPAGRAAKSRRKRQAKIQKKVDETVKTNGHAANGHTMEMHVYLHGQIVMAVIDDDDLCADTLRRAVARIQDKKGA